MKPNSRNPTDAEAVKAVLAGDRSAYAHLVRRYEGSVRGIALGILRDFEAARDVTQDVFVAAYEKLGMEEIAADARRVRDNTFPNEG